eukprot:10773891-Ditylum_brightwellii.AAC.1
MENLKQLKQILGERGVQCKGCLDRGDYIKRVDHQCIFLAQEQPPMEADMNSAHLAKLHLAATAD